MIGSKVASLGRRPRLIYAAILLVSFSSGFVDAATGRRDPVTATVTDFTVVVLLVVLIALWCEADVRKGGHPPLSARMRLLILLMAPVGFAVYIFRTRPFRRAIGALLLFLVANMTAGAVGIALGEKLLARHS